MQENRLLTPFLFSLLLLIVFFIWVNVMVAIISEVYQQENDRSLNVVQVDDDFQSMEPDVDQPQNDLKGMRYHSPVLADENEGHPAMIRLTPDKCVASVSLTSIKGERVRETVLHEVSVVAAVHTGLQGMMPREAPCLGTTAVLLCGV